MSARKERRLAMSGRTLLHVVLAVMPLTTAARCQDKATSAGSGSSSGGAGNQHGRVRSGLIAVGGGYYGPPFYVYATPNGLFTYVPPVVFIGPGGGPIVVPQAVPGGPAVNRGPMAPPPPPELVERPRQPLPRPSDPGRASQFVTLGDRLFRGNNLKKAEERYHQAARLDPGSAAPRLRLAQVALKREHYGLAANLLREAETAQPGWILTSPDVQSLYGEAEDFTRHLAKLESYLHVHPQDRDAWLVLGAEWFLSGRTARAADVFLRLHDPRRKPDVGLAAFLEASNLREAKTDPRPPGTAASDPFQ